MIRPASKYLSAILDLIFYGNFWIALCAAAMVIQTNLLINAEYLVDAIVWLVFGGTLFIYGVHRAIGISRLEDFLAEKRYGVIFHYRKHIRIYAVLGLMISGFFFLSLDRTTQLALVIPALLAALYVLPVFGKKRLRDINHIKIYLIAIVFAALTVLLPNIYLQGEWDLSILILFCERLLFIFLLTIPFDIRDLSVDNYSKVATLPSRFGLGFSKNLMLFVAVLLFLLVLGNFLLGFYQLGQLIALCISILLATILGYHAHPDRHDYYYTGAIDGMMVLQTALILITY